MRVPRVRCQNDNNSTQDGRHCHGHTDDLFPLVTFRTIGQIIAPNWQAFLRQRTHMLIIIIIKNHTDWRCCTAADLWSSSVVSSGSVLLARCCYCSITHCVIILTVMAWKIIVGAVTWQNVNLSSLLRNWYLKCWPAPSKSDKWHSNLSGQQQQQKDN